MSFKRIEITLLAVLALALTGISARAQVVLLPGYGPYGNYYGGTIGGFGNPYGAFNPYEMGYGNPSFYGYPNANMYYGQPGYGNTAYGPYDYFGAGYNTGYNSGSGYYGGPNPQAIPRTNDSVTVRKQTNNHIFMSWQGDPAMVSSISFAMLDANGAVVTRKTITSPPAQMTLTRTNKSVYAQIVIHYINGTTNTFTTPL